VADGGVLEYLPHHLIPFAGSSYGQETVAVLAPGATLIAWEALSAGRLARGERFAFEALSMRTRIHRHGVPELVDGLDLGPGGEPFGGHPYLASVWILAPAPLDELAEDAHAALAGHGRVLGSASAAAPGLLTARLMTGDAPSLYGALADLRARVRAALGLPAAPRAVH
jgi:urease accessory protein